jgi:hypothetical protein
MKITQKVCEFAAENQVDDQSAIELGLKAKSAERFITVVCQNI